jgi:serine protease Do
MSQTISSSARKRGARWLGAAAVAALLAGGAVQTGFVASTPAHAELRSLSQPIAMPSFADVIDRVKPAVVSVRVKVQNVANREGGPRGQQFAMPDLPEGHPLERFFREFRDRQQGENRGEARPGNPRGEQPRRFGQSQGSGFFVSADGYVVTNNHVVDNGAEVQVVMDDGRSLDAKVIGTDPRPISRS